jgi:hypothetical protein
MTGISSINIIFFIISQNGSSLIIDGRPELSRYHNGKFCLAVLQDDLDNLKVSKWYCDDESERKRYLFGNLIKCQTKTFKKRF